jgi:hypothetical protein
LKIEDRRWRIEDRKKMRIKERVIGYKFASILYPLSSILFA